LCGFSHVFNLCYRMPALQRRGSVDRDKAHIVVRFAEAVNKELVILDF
jgi:hypothetical protein